MPLVPALRVGTAVVALRWRIFACYGYFNPSDSSYRPT